MGGCRDVHTILPQKRLDTARESLLEEAPPRTPFHRFRFQFARQWLRHRQGRERRRADPHHLKEKSRIPLERRAGQTFRCLT